MSRKTFLISTVIVAVVALAVAVFITAVDARAESSAFVTTNHVTNFPYSLLSPEAKEALK